MMQTRIIVAVVAVPLLVLIIFLTPAWVLGAVIGLIAAFCAWEFMRCVESDCKLRIDIYAVAAAFLIPFGVSLLNSSLVYTTVLFLLFAVLFCELMLSFRKEKPMDFETVSSCMLCAGVMPLLLSAIVTMRVREHGSVYALLPFVAAFSSDSGAYFSGLYLGKNKLAPRISPHKTIEGSAGGFIAAVVLMAVYGIVLRIFHFEVNMPVLCVYGFLGALAGQLGDLAFSAVKRLCGVKDYGKLIPGHGGMLDRFDSMFWTAAMLGVLTSWVPAIN